MQRLDIIPDDGYTEPGYIKAIVGIHGDIRFTYRPMLIQEQSKATAEAGEAGRGKPERYDRVCAEKLAHHLLTWSLRDSSGTPLAIEINTLLRIKPMAFLRLWAIVLGTQASDIDPEWTEEVQAVKTEEQADYSPAPIGQARAEADEKNSVSG
jgi:hypothetical protein